MKLTGIELRNFRSIGDKPVVLSPWRKCNILIGQNNAGKSNVIKAVQRISQKPQKGKKQELLDLDFHKRLPENQFMFRLYFESDTSEDEELTRLTKTSSFYFDFSWQTNLQVTDHTFAHINDYKQANQLMFHLLERRWNQQVDTKTIRDEFLKYGETIFNRFANAIRPVYIIPEFRQIRSGNDYTLDGTSLVELLARYQRPEIGKDRDRNKFDRVEKFVQQLLHLPDATLEVSHDNPIIILKTMTFGYH